MGVLGRRARLDSRDEEMRRGLAWRGVAGRGPARLGDFRPGSPKRGKFGMFNVLEFAEVKAKRAA